MPPKWTFIEKNAIIQNHVFVSANVSSFAGFKRYCFNWVVNFQQTYILHIMCIYIYKHHTIFYNCTTSLENCEKLLPHCSHPAQRECIQVEQLGPNNSAHTLLVARRCEPSRGGVGWGPPTFTGRFNGRSEVRAEYYLYHHHIGTPSLARWWP